MNFFDCIISNNTFLYSSLYSFTNDNILQLLKKFGLEVKVERGNRVFPMSDKSSDVIKAFNKFLIANNVKVMLNSTVTNIMPKDGRFLVNINGESIEFDKIILATGGKSYPATGSTGDGFIFAKKIRAQYYTIKAFISSNRN